MTPEHQQIQIEVAEKMGWKESAHYFEKGESQCYNLPPYTTSLDAIQQVCLERFDGINGIVEFQQQLGKIEREKNREKSTWSWQLTALDWCKAFLETVKQLEEVK